MLREISCSSPGCGCKILRKSTDGMWRFSTKVLKSNEDGTGVIAVCKSCGRDVFLPIEISVPGEANGRSDLRKGFGIIHPKKP